MAVAMFKNETINAEIKTIKFGETIYFRAKDVAQALDYSNTAKAVQVHIFEEYKKTLAEIQTSQNGMVETSQNGTPARNEKQTIYITEPGLYQLIFSSKKEEAKLFTKWVVEEVLPTIRKTGMYKTPKAVKLQAPQIHITNEKELHHKIIDFIKKYYEHAIIVAGLGELQDTTWKRSNAFHMGYRGGQPDILILNRHKTHSGFAIELKTPTGKGKVSDNQNNFLQDLEVNNYKTLVSNDYDEVVMELIEYFKDVRISCPCCKRGFKSNRTLENHKKVIHKIQT
jgi:prophage antirepressor-like protein